MSKLSGFIAALVMSPGLWAQNGSADRIQTLERLMRDWAGLIHYGSDDSEVKPAKPGEDRVIFFGDQITEYWGKDKEFFFPGRPWLNRGVAGQTTDQMLVRFRQDVISLKPKVVVILGGINDVAGPPRPATAETGPGQNTPLHEVTDGQTIPGVSTRR